MLIEVVWTLAIAATGVLSKSNNIKVVSTGSRSTSCQSDIAVNVCYLDPDIGSGERRFEAFFYDWRTDQCLPMMFGFTDKEPYEENRFMDEDQCNIKCRTGVSNQCFQDPEIIGINEGTKRWTYNYTSLKCVPFLWIQSRRRPKTNTFDSEQECIRKCKIPDLGLCARGFLKQCKHGDDLYMRYNYEKQKCEILKPHECPQNGNGFYTFRQCYQRCGRFVKNKCKLPIQNMSFCSDVKYRYGYNTKTLKCEKFLGCEDSGNSFPTAKECWETCARALRHPCVAETRLYIVW
uniref:Putative salivary kunitz domain protein n=1 Tax=Ixodes ricinus TaxID=34613 RepID=A0A0K8R6J0_IXORI